MFDVMSVLQKDGYKVGHPFQYRKGTQYVNSNWTPRKSRVEGVDGVIFFGLQYFIEEYLIRQFNRTFFERPKDEVLKQYQRRITNYLGPINTDHIAALHEHGHLPLVLKSLDEGTKVPFRVPCVTVQNTEPEFYWLTNMIETIMSNVLWMPCTSATTAFRYRRVFEHFANKTSQHNKAFVMWQGHDFSMRGLAGLEAACLSGAAHLLSFTGTDTIPAIDFLEEYYGANCEKELIGGSVPATEHSVMSIGGKNGEIDTIRRLIVVVYPSGIVSIVCDTWDFWKVLIEYLPQLHTEVMTRDGKVVIRPDSGDPVKIICGDPDSTIPHVCAGAIETLWNIFGGTVNDQGYKELDPHIGLIYGDSITPERQLEILHRLSTKGFASTNVVLGVGSFTYQYVTRDTYGFAMKATAGKMQGEGWTDIYKDPATDDGTKKSATGLLRLDESEDGVLYCTERCTEHQEAGGLLTPRFIDGLAMNKNKLSGIRKRVESYL